MVFSAWCKVHNCLRSPPSGALNGVQCRWEQTDQWHCLWQIYIYDRDITQRFSLSGVALMQQHSRKYITWDRIRYDTSPIVSNCQIHLIIVNTLLPEWLRIFRKTKINLSYCYPNHKSPRAKGFLLKTDKIFSLQTLVSRLYNCGWKMIDLTCFIVYS